MEQVQESSGSNQDKQQALEYTRRVYANVLDWYKVADSKGQLLLTLNGIFITVVAGTVLGKPSEVVDRTREFGVDTWLLFMTTALFIVSSVLCAALCLRSRLGDPAVRSLIQQFNVDPERRETYPADVAW